MKTTLIAAAMAALSLSAAQAADLGGAHLSVGSDTTYPPMETIDPATGQVVGFDVDVVNAVCERINCTAEFVTTAWDGIFGALQQGDFDLVASGVSITDERKQTMDFTDPYIIVSQSIMLRVEDEGLTVDDFKAKGLKLASQTATTNAALAEELVGRDNIALYDSFATAVSALQNGDVSGLVIDGTSAAAYEKEFAGELIVGITGLQADPLGFVFQKGDERVAAFNEGLAAIQADGTLDALVAKYWGSE
ncbi:transporter substrate-binding domain-containing protein [Albidovulum sp.]|mgnify:CR=1 FL=1|uniref:transporter substrate-binding domain-containing protein n=1 Tax=Albidovulum sp. TaxID=1872424 RepID=UPI001D54EDD6|nr:transporter substrate-binding domain-containing protein [Paracoccaceae bacterium]MCC0046533.1 transporter substrate-binding domain-containing protein [Defluviimonas sp.]HPE25601.1 transporter substrate-binding domain-containing protein [Albidovulum sp.]MCB2120701.1 transporter substrate-binding domain-containing protein [Paracoccaceae bacterium]MCB2121290.1 transporter substrate-binding domain-containing protein [Paracoccaceae bacterium]